jgi:uncharacterized membrane protein YozB (DUF420 family)
MAGHHDSSGDFVMAKLQPDLRSSTRADHIFYLVMSLILAAIVVFGFSHTVPHDLEAPGLPGLLKFHAAVFVAWVLLFIAQPALIMKRSVALHRKLGWVGLALACAMVVLGGSAIMFALWNHTLPFFYPPGLFLVRGIVGLTLFAGLVGAAILRRRQAEWHKRLMLCAAIVVMTPGLERALPLPLFGSAWPFVADGVQDMIALIGPVMDLVRRKRVHPAYLCGVSAIIAGQAVVDLIAASPIAAFLLRAVGAA